MANNDDLPRTARDPCLSAIIFGVSALCTIFALVTPELQFSPFHLRESFGTLVVLISTLALAALYSGATLHHHKITNTGVFACARRSKPLHEEGS